MHFLIQPILNFWNNFPIMFPRLSRSIRWGFRLLLVIFIMDAGYLMGVWPEWKWYANGPVPKSRFIEYYEQQLFYDPNQPKLRWSPISFEEIPRDMLRAVLAAEDAKFFHHEGIDAEAFKKAMEYNWEQKRIAFGASTISQQTVKNLFLSGSRNPLRKWHEYILTYAMESNLTKQRIMEIYLNIAEFGVGVYGIDAAARYYWGIPASQMTRSQAIELAATLPAPKHHNPKTRSAFFKRQAAKIKRNSGL